jgi:hypothetical protein
VSHRPTKPRRKKRKPTRVHSASVTSGLYARTGAIYTLEAGSQLHKITEQNLGKKDPIAIEIRAPDGKMIYKAPSRVDHVGRVFRAGSLFGHVYAATPCML